MAGVSKFPHGPVRILQRPGQRSLPARLREHRPPGAVPLLPRAVPRGHPVARVLHLREGQARRALDVRRVPGVKERAMIGPWAVDSEPQK